MIITTQYNPGDTIAVRIDGGTYSAVITEVIAYGRPDEPVLVRYKADATITLTDPQGRDYQSSREWIGTDEDIL